MKSISLLKVRHLFFDLLFLHDIKTQIDLPGFRMLSPSLVPVSHSTGMANANTNNIRINSLNS